MTRAAQVLVVGVGPTGLALALQAHDHGAHVRIVREETPGIPTVPGTHPAPPRTLEVLRPLGVMEPLLTRVNTAVEASLRLGSRGGPCPPHGARPCRIRRSLTCR